VAATTANPRYRWERNQGVPRKIGSKLWLYDCINCDKCVPVLSQRCQLRVRSPGGGHRLRQFRAATGRPSGVCPAVCCNCQGAPTGQLRGRVQRLRQTAMSSAPRRRPVRREAAASRKPGDVPEVRWKNGLLHRLGGQWDRRFRLSTFSPSTAPSPGSPTFSRSPPPPTVRASRPAAAVIEIRLSGNQALSLVPETRRGASGMLDMLPYLKTQTAGRIGRRSAPRSFCQRRGTSGGSSW